jgi:hypothetical protein
MSRFASIEEKDISVQLNATLRASVTDALLSRRPILTHLNADSSWLLSLPIPHHTIRNRIYFHILIDPWLRGSQSDVAKFFSQQWHKEESAVQTIADVEVAIQGIEEAAQGELDLEETKLTREKIASLNKSWDITLGRKHGGELWIDAVVISHEFTDHMHKETLLEISTEVPVFATSKAADSIRSWRHFSFVDEIGRFTGDCTKSLVPRLPSWVSITRLAYAGQDLLYYHSAVMIVFKPYQRSLPARANAECVVYTPHGITPRDIQLLVTADPKIETLALLHGLQAISLPRAQLNLGAHNGLKLQRLLNTKYWISTHDEVKTGGGIVSWLLNRKMITIGEAIERENSEIGDGLEGTKVESMAYVGVIELGNGESMILE